MITIDILGDEPEVSTEKFCVDEQAIVYTPAKELTLQLQVIDKPELNSVPFPFVPTERY